MTFALGVASALGAPLVMTLGFILWEENWKGGSAFSLNLFKCNLATLGFLGMMLATSNSNGLFDWDFDAVGFLVLSSTIGILIGYWTWLEGLKLLGARRVILMDSFKPFLAAFLGWLILDERLELPALSGVLLTVVGVVVVSWERTAEEEKSEIDHEDGPKTNTPALMESAELRDDGIPTPDQCEETGVEDAATDSREDTPQHEGGDNHPVQRSDEALNMPEDRNGLHRGYLMSILNVGLDTYGALIIKEHGSDLSVWEINFIRFGFAGITMLLFSLVLHFVSWYGSTAGKGTGTTSPAESNISAPTERMSTDSIRKKQCDPARWYALPNLSPVMWGRIVGGVFLVTFLTPAMSNYALFQIALALALTLGSVGPIYALLISFLWQRLRLTNRALFGNVLAVAGVAVLAFWGNLPDDEELPTGTSSST